MELPLWLHDPEWVGMNRTDASRAIAAGLAFRPLDETVRGALEEAEASEEAGLSPEREAELLERWRAQ
jgi:2'-hydroxyisoflavone reductase